MRFAKLSRRLVVDASVACSCGNAHTADPVGKLCRDFLSSMLNSDHLAVMTPSIRLEWGRHQSNFARSWRVSMVARRRIVALSPEETLQEKLRACCDGKRLAAALKDAHLLEAALVTDQSVVSLDTSARKIYRSLCPAIKRLRAIAWINPAEPEERAVDWLEGGAQREDSRTLGSSIA